MNKPLFLAFRSLGVIMILTWTISTPAMGEGCNLVPNGRLEQGSATAFDDWSLKGVSGQGIFTVSTYPGEVQSGARAVSVNMSTPGAMHFSADPESTLIPAEPNTTYTASARLLSSNGQRAGLMVVEWNNGGAVKTTFLPNGGGSGEWITLEGSVTTQPTTDHISIRLLHHIDAGTFLWDDIALWEAETGKRCVDTRHHVAQSTPGFRMCKNVGNLNCIDGNKLQSGEFVVNYGNGIRDYITFNGDGLSSDLWIGVHKNLEGANWRCFADPGDQCGDADGSNAEITPHAMPTSLMLPVLATAPSSTGVTAGAQMTHDWASYDVRKINPVDGSQPALIGLVSSRKWMYVAASVNFGGDLGTQTNVLILESEVTGAANPAGFDGGERMERYYFVQGYGRVSESALEDSVCRIGPNALNCDGHYDVVPPPGLIQFNTEQNLDFTFDLDAPFGSDSWW